jgi:hypothetical protein
VTSFDIATVVYDTNGNQRWVRRYNNPIENGQDLGRDVAFGPNGEVYVGGHTLNGAAPIGDGLDFALIKYDANGNEEWVRTYDGPAPPQSSADRLARLRVDSQGNVVITGSSQQVDFTFGFTTIKYDANGNQLWVRSHVSPGGFGDYPRAMVVGPDDAVYVTGQGGNSQQDYLTVKYDTDGNEEWSIHYVDSDPSPDRANAIALDAGGNVLVTGETPFTTVRYEQAGLTTGVGGSRPRPGADRIWLEAAAPNPFRRSTLLRFGLPREGRVRLEVHDVAGRRIATLLDSVRPAGEHAVVFDGRDFPSGVYFSVLEAVEVRRVSRISLIK